MECGKINSWYRRENSKPTVTICYEFIWGITKKIPLCSCGSPTLRAITVYPKSVSIIFCAWRSVPTRCNLLT